MADRTFSLDEALSLIHIYTVEAARLGQITDYDKLTIEVWTNGSITPGDALGLSAKLVKDCLLYTSTWRTICPLRLIFSISSGDLRMIRSSPKLIRFLTLFPYRHPFWRWLSMTAKICTVTSAIGRSALIATSRPWAR